MNVLHEVEATTERLNSSIVELADGRKKLQAAHQEELSKIRAAQKEQISEYDRSMFEYLWNCRQHMSTSDIARIVGLSRQTLYEKWKHYGYAIDGYSEE